jgi:capsular polysaccharide transport system permease protein
MHGISTLVSPDEVHKEHSSSLRAWLYARRWFMLCVLLPTALVATYYGLIASDRFESEAHYVVRSSDNPSPMASGLGLVFGLGGGGGAQGETNSVSDYLSSHDAVAALSRKLDMVGIFRRPEADIISRLRAEPKAETLLRYYNDHVRIRHNPDTGITTLRVQTFRPADSLTLAHALLELGEDRVNTLNERIYKSTVANARRQLAEAEVLVAQVQGRMTSFRRSGRDINPEGTGAVQTQLVSRLREELAAARAQLMMMARTVNAGSPQVVAMRERVRALEAQVGSENARLTGGLGDIATGIGNYEELRLRQEFAAKRYEAAAANLERARAQAEKQQVFIVRVVEPNLPQKARYPERLKIILTTFAGLLVVYAIGWLIVAGVKEHAE